MQESNIALALKYRPRRFEDLIGQDTISQTLSLALDSRRLGHAYLFSGLRGSGKTSTARIFAKSLICEKGESSDSCETCENCKSANAYKHIDIIEMDAASNRKIDDIRDLIEQTKYKPSVARYKIFIIDEVHMLTREAFNALLKTLEEPPNYVKFILATTDPLKLPPTILSRTQHFSFKKIPTADVVHHLQTILDKENVEYEKEALEILARSGSGSLRDTLTLLDQAIIFAKGRVDVASVVKMLGVLDPAKIEAMFEAIMRQDTQAVAEMAKEFEAYDPEVLIEDIIEYLKRRFYEPSGMMSAFIVERFFRIMAQTKSLLAMNADNGFAITLMMYKMLEALKGDEIEAQMAKVRAKIDELPNEQPQAEAPAPQKTEPAPEPAVDEVPTAESAEAVNDAEPESVQASETEKADETREQFTRLIAAITDRDPELGECFEKSVQLIGYEEGTLSWMSCADEMCKKQLRTYWSVIRHLTEGIFGIEVKIKAVPCDKEPEPDGEDDKKKTDDSQLTPPHANETSSSMIEDVELGDAGSCMQNSAGLADTRSQEFNGTEILEEPFVKKAIELFDAQKIRIRSKI